MILSVASYAKINLFLYVTGIRADGFHDLLSLMTRITLADAMRFTFHDSGVEVACDHPLVPEDETNLAHRAATLFFKACDQRGIKMAATGVTIEIHKRIPVGGGLGGGSSNAATVLSVLNAQCRERFSVRELMDMGYQLGADVPFFLYGGTALAAGVGEKLNRAPNPFPEYVVVCDPGIAVSTARVFREYDFCLTSQRKCTIESASNILSLRQDVDVRPYLHNDLEAAAFRAYPEVGTARDDMAQVLSRPVLMSGSGGSLFSLFSDEESALRACDLLRKSWIGKNRQVFVAALQKN